MTAVETALASAGGLLDPAGDAAASSVSHVNIGVGKGGIRKKRCRTTKAAKRPCDVKRMMVPESLQLQRLFLMCRQVFKGPGTVPSDCDVERLCRILDDMMPEDVGLSSNLQFFNPKGAMEGNPRVTNTTIYKGNNFSLCIFFLPSTSVIPLHNHPGMTVFSKLLLGRMHIKAYDWADVLPSAVIGDSNKDGHAMRLARLKANKTFTPQCNTSVLYPTSGGNIHEFRAITPCAVLDVLGPPYSKDDGRDCSYYKDIPYDALSRADGKVANAEESDLYGWLEEIEIPEESKMDVIQYLGPQVV